ncbi:MAG: hypothetical protein ACRDNL_23235 [Spirillospora sp.]
MARGQDLASLVLLTAEGQDPALIHRSVLDRVAEIADRLGCRAAARLGWPPVVFRGAELARLRRDLEQVIAFADAVRRTGWVLGEMAVAPGDRPERVLETSEGGLFAYSARGFEWRDAAGSRPVTELSEASGTARRVPLTDLTEPLTRVVARAEILEVRERAATTDRGGLS